MRCVATIGIFDGVHIGHQEIIKAVVRRAKKLSLKSVAITFDPHPLKVLEPKNAPPLLISLKHRLRLIKELGIDSCVVINFTKSFSLLDPETFVKNVLLDKLRVKELYVGENFCLGKARSGDVSFLKEMGKKYGFAVHSVSFIKKNGIIVSSTQIRNLIIKGGLDTASRLLKRSVSVLGTVVKGAALGRELGYPTANINPHHEAIPPAGVYVIKIKLLNKQYSGILNIGKRPTFTTRNAQESEPTIEAHIFDFKGRIYGKDIEVYFVKKIRDESRFSSKEKLISQIRRDEIKARKILGGHMKPKLTEREVPARGGSAYGGNVSLQAEYDPTPRTL